MRRAVKACTVPRIKKIDGEGFVETEPAQFPELLSDRIVATIRRDRREQSTPPSSGFVALF
jgi:hypothetical protein